ncbi:hypothetical protein KC851_03300 [Candidatus Kaiserbacteria bacterium]|nr:hypothetical protein [Candidatus Kaiserbacteria bacterium]
MEDNYKSPKKMKKLGELFSVYKTRFKAPQATVEKVFIETVREVLGYQIESKNVSYTTSTKTISLQLPSLLKNEIKLKEKEVLNQLKNKIGEVESPKFII